LRNRLMAASAAVLLLPWAARAVVPAVPVEQIEAYEVDAGDNPDAPTRYAPVNFAGSPTVTVLPGQLGNAFPNQTFHAVPSTADNNTNSNHAMAVGQDMYGYGSVAYPFVTNIYCLEADIFLSSSTNMQDTTGVGPLPGSFDGGAKIINNSYVGTFVGGTDSHGVALTANTDLDVQRRLDYMINSADVTFVAAAVSNVGGTAYQDLAWSSFNSLAVSGAQTFSPTGSPGKPHADLYGGGDASFATAVVSGYATALYGSAQAASQSDALHGVTVRSLLMAGATKAGYTRQTTNNLDLVHGAGTANYDNSLAILQDAEKPLVADSSNTVTGTPSGNQDGWSYGTIAAGSKQALIFQSANTITGITASLNWDINITTSGSTIDTNSQIFPNLALNVYPVTYSGGHYTLGAAYTTTGLASSTAGDNVQYLYSTSTLPAGTYAFVITGDASLPAAAGFSYTLAGSFASQWNASGGASWGTLGDWTNGIPNGQAAQANLPTGSGTITLNGDRTVGQITFGSSSGFTIAQGAVPSGVTGQLTIDDTGDSTGTVNPLLTVTAGNQTISAPVVLVNGVTINTASSTGLTISGAVTGSGGLIKTGVGSLTLSAADAFGNTTVNGGTLTLGPAGSLTNGVININSTATLKFAANTGSGILVRNISPAIDINAGATVSLAIPSAQSTRQVLIPTGGLNLAGTTNAWTSKLDLGSNDLDMPAGTLATITNQIKQGFAYGSWTGLGIDSAAAAGNSSHLTALGVILNNDGSGHPLFGSGAALGLFDGQNPAVTDVLVKYTYYGDANLDGQVDGSDYTKIDNGFNNHLTGWINGDFNYDGVVDGSDYTLIDNAFNNQGASLSPNTADLVMSPTTQLGGTTAVPEPSTLMLIGIGGLLLRRARRHPCAV
jgi:fibronectin-binding autotransporter adhesin